MKKKFKAGDKVKLNQHCSSDPRGKVFVLELLPDDGFLYAGICTHVQHWDLVQEEPRYSGNANKFLKEMCDWAHGQRTDVETITVDLSFTIFGPVGKKPTVASVGVRPISKKPPVNAAVYRHMLEMKAEEDAYKIGALNRRIDELQTMFAKELEEREQEEWENYGENL